MKKIQIILTSAVIALLFASGCGRQRQIDCASLETELIEFVKDKDARIGIAVITNEGDTVAVNGDMPFPMMSVYKFPIALGVGEYCRFRGMDFGDTCCVTHKELHTGTWSPMMEKYGTADMVAIPIRELLAYAVEQSDNNASDILLAMIGGASAADGYIADINNKGIDIQWTEDEMHQALARCYDNTSTPIAMGRLLDKFYREFNDSLSAEIKLMMESCETGTDRLAKPLPSDAVIGHKTGTGDKNSDGRIIAINDVGYIRLPDNRHYVIAVFVSDSAYGFPETSQLIASISEIVYNHIAIK